MITEIQEHDHPDYGKLSLPIRDITIVPPVLKDKIWEEYNVEYVFKKIPKGTVAIDCGAFIGLHSIMMAKQDPSIDVIAIEMMPFHYQCLLDNVYKSELNNILPVHCCLSDKIQGYTKLPDLDYGEKHNLGGTALYFPRSDKRVETRTLDQISQQFRKRVSFIKIDVEGNEIPTLEGARLLIATHRPLILIEIWKAKLEQFKKSIVYSYLQNLNYTLKHHVNDDYLLEPQPVISA